MVSVFFPFIFLLPTILFLDYNFWSTMGIVTLNTCSVVINYFSDNFAFQIFFF